MLEYFNETRLARSSRTPTSGFTRTLEAVVDLYDSKKGLNLTAQQKADLVQYLRSL
jgi:hypothetical protein